MEQVPNILDLIFLAILAFFGVRALFKGFVREIMGLIGVIAAVLISAVTYQTLGDFLERVSGIPGGWWQGVGFALVLVVVFGVFTYIGHGLSKLIQAGPFSGLDRLLGGAAGLLKGVLICYLLLNVFLLFSPLSAPSMVTESISAPYVVRVGRFLVDLVPADLTESLQKQAGLLSASQSEKPAKE